MLTKNVSYTGLITITSKMEHNILIIQISDNGVGIAAESKKESQGLKIVLKRIKLFNIKNKLTFTKLPQGTAVQLILYPDSNPIKTFFLRYFSQDKV